MINQAPIFEETVRNYLDQVAQIDLAGIAETLGHPGGTGGGLDSLSRKNLPGFIPRCFDPRAWNPSMPSALSCANISFLLLPRSPGTGKTGFPTKTSGMPPLLYPGLSTTASGPSPGTSPDAWNSSGKQPAVWEAFPRLWSSPTSSPVKFRPCPKSRCSSCSTTRMKTSRPNAACCFNAGRKNFWTWNAWLSSAGCWPIPWPRRPAWGNGPSCDRVQTALEDDEQNTRNFGRNRQFGGYFLAGGFHLRVSRGHGPLMAAAVRRRPGSDR